MIPSHEIKFQWTHKRLLHSWIKPPTLREIKIETKLRPRDSYMKSQEKKKIMISFSSPWTSAGRSPHFLLLLRRNLFVRTFVFSLLCLEQRRLHFCQARVSSYKSVYCGIWGFGDMYISRSRFGWEWGIREEGFFLSEYLEEEVGL